jgi:hypothetical protein
MRQRRIINIIRKGQGIGDTELPSFLADMSAVPEPAKGRCIIAVANLSHAHALLQSREPILRDTLCLNISDHRMLDRVNQDAWTDPVVIIGALQTLAYGATVKRIGKIAFYGHAALFPLNHPQRKRIEGLLHGA